MCGFGKAQYKFCLHDMRKTEKAFSMTKEDIENGLKQKVQLELY